MPRFAKPVLFGPVGGPRRRALRVRWMPLGGFSVGSRCWNQEYIKLSIFQNLQRLALTWKSLDLKPIIVQWKTWKRPKLGKETSLSWRHPIFFSQRWWKEDTLYIDVKILEAPSQSMFAPKKSPQIHLLRTSLNYIEIGFPGKQRFCIRINFDKMWVWLGYCIWKRLKV